MAASHRGITVTLPYINFFRDRHGKLRFYFRRNGKRIRLQGRPGSPEFMLSYNAALAGYRIEPKPIANRSSPGSVSATIVLYYTDNAFLGLAPSTRNERRIILERFRREFGDLRFSGITEQIISRRLGKLRPFAARSWLKTLKGVMQFAKRIGLRQDDPTERMKPVKAKAGSIHSWTEDEIAIFERRHALGTRARLAMALLLHTAARRGDVVGLGPQHIRSGWLSYRQQKTGRALAIPVRPALAEAIALCPSAQLTFLATIRGTPYTAKAFGKLFRKWCDEAGLPQCSAHGLRKAQARQLAENGCSAHEIASITGHKTLSEVQRYADAANQATLAESAMKRTRS